MLRLPTVREMQPGEVLLYVELNELGQMTIDDALAILEELGYFPELRYRQWTAHGKTKIGLYALLKHEHRSPDQLNGYLEANLDELAEHIPTDAIRSPRKLYPRLKIVVAA